jgi:hypothetical protein
MRSGGEDIAVLLLLGLFVFIALVPLHSPPWSTVTWSMRDNEGNSLKGAIVSAMGTYFHEQAITDEDGR